MTPTHAIPPPLLDAAIEAVKAFNGESVTIRSKPMQVIIIKISDRDARQWEAALRAKLTHEKGVAPKQSADLNDLAKVALLQIVADELRRQAAEAEEKLCQK